MKTTALITDASTPLGDQLVRRYLAEGYGVAATRSTDARIDTPLVAEGEDLLFVDWKRNSPISAKNVLLTATNRFGNIDQTLVLLTPELDRKLLQDTGTEAIDRAVDLWIKGSLFLLKAVFQLYNQKGEGLIALISHSSQTAAAVPPPLESALRGGFRGAAESLFAGIGQQNVSVFGFESHSTEIEEFADYIFDTLNTKGVRLRGRWHRFPPRPGFLAALSPK